MAAPMPCCISPVLAPVRARAAGVGGGSTCLRNPRGRAGRSAVPRHAIGGRFGATRQACAALYRPLRRASPLAGKTQALGRGRARRGASPFPSPRLPFPSPPPSVLRSRGAGARCGRRGQAGGGRGRALPGVPQGVLVAQDCRVLDAVPWGLCQAFRRASRAVLDRIALGRLQDLTSA